MIDWYGVALEPAVRRLANVLRREFGVWIGILGPDGQQVSLGMIDEERPRLLCARMMANPHDGPGGEPASCFRSNLDWVETDQTTSDPFKSCHAGLSAISLPLRGRNGTFLGSLYASGFLSAERGNQPFDHLRELLVDRQWARSADAERLVDTVPVLDRAQRAVLLSLLRALADELLRELARKPEDLHPIGDRYGDMIGTSAEMKRLFATLRKISRGDSTVLIRGENGTGKELIARAIHQHSRRRSQSFIAQNCAAIPADLIESELFGHRKGAFSGAHRDRMGLFETANHGTFLLDEIGEMDVSLQVKLLRVLQEGTFLPVGDNSFRKVDVRILCATNRNLEELVERGAFREDLFYRINVITVDAPPLRHRREDIPLLAAYFLNKACHRHDRTRKRLSPQATELLVQHPWPGNVRELENEIERAVIMTADEPVIEADDLTMAGAVAPRPSLRDLAPAGVDLPTAIETLEREMILEGLRRTGWNKTQTAKELGVSRRNLIRKVAAYDLEKLR